jgi:hypothetical protein
MRLLAIAAAGFNLSNSPAMLIIRQGGRVGCALAAAYCSDGCIAKRSANRKQLPSFFAEPGGGPGESAEVCGA